MRIAFKEWAVVCRALGEGRQTVILRKGGVAETGGGFRPEHEQFLLLPTYLHQSADQIKSEFRSELALVEAERPPSTLVRLSHWARVVEVRLVESIETLSGLDEQHLWTQATALERFHRWRRDSVHALFVKVFALPASVDLDLPPEYAGCKSWVSLIQEVDVASSTPVLSDEQLAERQHAFQHAFS